MSRKVLEFVSRAQWQDLMRGRRAYSHYKRMTLGLKFTDAERLQQVAEDRANYRKWSSKHGPLPSGAIVVHFTTRDTVECPPSDARKDESLQGQSSDSSLIGQSR